MSMHTKHVQRHIRGVRYDNMPIALANAEDAAYKSVRHGTTLYALLAGAFESTNADTSSMLVKTAMELIAHGVKTENYARMTVLMSKGAQQLQSLPETHAMRTPAVVAGLQQLEATALAARAVMQPTAQRAPRSNITPTPARRTLQQRGGDRKRRRGGDFRRRRDDRASDNNNTNNDDDNNNNKNDDDDDQRRSTPRGGAQRRGGKRGGGAGASAGGGQRRGSGGGGRGRGNNTRGGNAARRNGH